MSLTILARLREGRYDAAEQRPSQPEWPPHPARLFCALVASAVEPEDWAALRWLESAGAPTIWADAASSPSPTAGYVVTNVAEPKGGSQTWPGRTNNLRKRAATVPATGEFAVEWPDAIPDDVTSRRLSGLARRVPYLGRSTSPVTLTVKRDEVEPRLAWRRYEPRRIGHRPSTSLRIPYPGYSDQLWDAYAEGRRAWTVEAYTIPYATPDETSGAAGPLDSPLGEVLTFGFPRGSGRWAGDSLLALTVPLRQAVISRIGTAVPAEVSGHGAEGRSHVAYVALPDVGHENADGHLLGVGLLVPRNLSDEGLSTLLTHVVDDPLRKLTVRRDLTIDVEHDPYRAGPWGLAEERWTAAPRGATTWVTATPLMLDRYPSRHDSNEEMVAQSLVTAGLPEPAWVEVSPAPLIKGAVHRPRRRTIPSGRPHRPLLHARVCFGRPLVGPVLSGSLRYLGLGLFVPERRLA